jgi:hypothetical protein
MDVKLDLSDEGENLGITSEYSLLRRILGTKREEAENI